MEIDVITEIGINSKGQLYVRPSSVKFPYIYREAQEVHWNEKLLFLYSPEPKKWSYLDWYKQIIRVAKIQSCDLKLNRNTIWVNISSELKTEILNQ